MNLKLSCRALLMLLPLASFGIQPPVLFSFAAHAEAPSTTAVVIVVPPGIRSVSSGCHPPR